MTVAYFTTDSLARRIYPNPLFNLCAREMRPIIGSNGRLQGRELPRVGGQAGRQAGSRDELRKLQLRQRLN